MAHEACKACPLVGELEFAHTIIVELQHLVRELRDELGNHKAAAAGWPLGPDGEELRL
jgi:hypothetical protein